MKLKKGRYRKLVFANIVVIICLCIINCATIYARMGGAEFKGYRNMKWPVPGYNNLSSCFFDEDAKTRGERSDYHYALDIATGGNKVNVVAAYEGTVVETVQNGRNDRGFGNQVIIRHNYTTRDGLTRTLYTHYSHLSSIGVSTNQQVSAGQYIGKTGGTASGGSPYGIHLDFQILTSANWRLYKTYSKDPFANEMIELPSNLYKGGDTACCDNYISEVKQLYSKPISNDPLSISNVQVSDVNSNSYKVSCNITGNVTRALFPTWPSADDGGNPIWHEGTISGNTASCVIRRSDHGNKNGDYISHIYIYDSAGNSTSAAAPLVVMGDTQAPVISNIKVSEIKMDSYTVTCKVYDNGGVTLVKFPTWPSADDSGNPIWHEGTINGDTESCVIKKSDHGNKTGLYLTHIYAYDMNGNMTAGQAPGVIVGDTEPPVIENIKIIDVTEESYTIICTVKDNNSSGTISVRFPTWPSADDSGNPIWHEGKVNGDTASCVIKKSEHGNKTGTYISHIYAYDALGNSSSVAAPAVELGKKHQHVYTSSIKKPATCTEHGIRLYTCKDNDDSYEEEIPATGHQHTELRNVKAATCAQEGYTGDTYCKDCNTKLSSGKTIAKKEHTWDSGKITTAATCSGKGIKTYTCTGCNATRTEEIPSTGHQHTELRNVKVATCASEGYTGDTYCMDCNTKLTSGKVLPKTDHTWDYGKVTQNATCTTKGIKTFACTVCKSTRIEEIPEIGHVNKITKFAKNASCKSEGYTGDIYCQDCGALLEDGKIISKTEHTWNAGEITKTATCTTAGVKTFTCTSCGTTRTEVIAATGHGSTETRNEKTASCSSEGYTGDLYCTVCGQKISSGSVIAKTGHSWDNGVITKEPTAAEEGIKTYTCRNCGATQTETLAKLKHSGNAQEKS